MFRLARPFLVIQALLLLVPVLAIPTVAQAKCCSCIVEGKTLCLTDPPKDDCAGLKDANPDLKDVACKNLDDAQCKTVAENGVCNGGKELAGAYTKKVNIVGKFEIIAPQMNVPIPGLDFGPSRSFDVTSKGASTTGGTTSTGGKVEIDFLGRYISAIYKYLVGISLVTASVMVVYGGFLYVMGATIPSINKGKEVITDAAIGTALLLSSVTILATINPQLVEFKPLQILVVTPGAFERERQLASDAVSLGDCVKNPGSGPPTLPMTCSGSPATTQVREAAIAIQGETGVPAYLIMGVVANESSFSDKACPYNNCGGIKCYPPPGGVGWVAIGQTIDCGASCALIKTKEDLHDGKGQIDVMACFKKFDPPPPGDKWKERFRHVAGILKGKHYDHPGFSWKDYQDNPNCMAKFMQKSGWATATNYGEAMQKNFKSHCLVP